MKIQKEPSVFLYPYPVVLVSLLDLSGRNNIITLAWVGIACSKPPILSLGIRPKRYSSKIIEETGEFVVNIPPSNLLKETDYCGIVSGRKVDKFAESGMTPEAATKVKAPLIRECPVNLECILKKKVELGTHNMYLGEILTVHIDSSVLDKEGNIDYRKAYPFVYNQGEYWDLGKRIGVYGLSKSRS